MVSVAVSRIGKTSVFYVESGAKITIQYYSDKLLGQGLLPDIRARCGHYNKMVHHLTLSVTCSVTMLVSLSQTHVAIKQSGLKPSG